MLVRFHGRYHVTASLLAYGSRGYVCVTLRRSRYVRWRQALEQVLESERCGTYGFPHCSQTLLLRRVGSLPSKTGPLVCPASNRYQPKLSFPVYFEPSIHFTLPIGNTLVHETTNGAACLVDNQSISNSSQVGAIRGKWAISLCITSRRCGGLVMFIERPRTGRAPRRLGRSRCRPHRRSAARRFQMAHQGAVTATRLGERAHTAQPRDQRQHRRARRRVEIASVGVRSWIACPSPGLYGRGWPAGSHDLVLTGAATVDDPGGVDKLRGSGELRDTPARHFEVSTLKCRRSVNWLCSAAFG